ncbi:hypothetical protein [Antiquaquibacter soli]|uniref:DUF4190 domain-containing protein n=1 Tax=Antiquaquibacter soli TaxID=3064523 RepID=A0ABT9BRJ9_9MICO|nr:hypothetical protein [Protaetiibacter sp. WY-16]MDO7883668.1 hypothetical protein [Protaetiibacter sp. WY-16]
MTDARARDDLLGAVGMPLGILAVLLSATPMLPIAIPWLSWAPAAVPLVLGWVGWRRARRFGAARYLSVASLVLGIAALLMILGWFILAVALRTLSDQGT